MFTPPNMSCVMCHNVSRVTCPSGEAFLLSTGPTPSSFFNTVIFNFYHVSFLAFFAISLELVRCTESVRQRNHWLCTKKVFSDRFCDQLNVSFLALTQYDKQITIKQKKMPKKKTKSKLKITVIRKLDWGILLIFIIYFKILHCFGYIHKSTLG